MNFVELIQILTNNPVLMLLLATGPFALIGYFSKTFPSGWLILVFGCACISSLLVLLNSNLYMLVLAIDFAIYIVAVIDVVQVPKATDFEVDRECLRVASLKKDHHVTMMVTNRSVTLSAAAWGRNYTRIWSSR